MDFEDVAGFDEEGNLDGDAGLEGGGLGRVVGGVAFDAFAGLGDFEFDGAGEIDGDGVAFEEENFNWVIFYFCNF